MHYRISQRQIVPLKIKELKLETIMSSQSAAIIIHLNSAVVEIQNGVTNSVIENTLQRIYVRGYFKS